MEYTDSVHAGSIPWNGKLIREAGSNGFKSGVYSRYKGKEFSTAVGTPVSSFPRVAKQHYLFPCRKCAHRLDYKSPHHILLQVIQLQVEVGGHEGKRCCPKVLVRKETWNRAQFWCWRVTENKVFVLILWDQFCLCQAGDWKAMKGVWTGFDKISSAVHEGMKRWGEKKWQAKLYDCQERDKWSFSVVSVCNVKTEEVAHVYAWHCPDCQT